MPQTLFDKIWNAHLVATRADGRALIYMDRHVLDDVRAPHAFRMLERQGREVRRKDLTLVVQDHSVSTSPARLTRIDPAANAFVDATRDAAARHGVRLLDIGDPEQGISHVVAPELGMVLPGATHAVPDSHASTVGGLGALAFGCGTTELSHILATQVMAMKRPKRMQVRLDGKLARHVTAKDVALRIIAEVGVAEAEAFAAGRKLRVTKVPFSANPKALINGDTRGFVKILSDPATGVVLGGAIVGRNAAELISVIAVAVTNHLKVVDIVDSLLVHPALSESLADAAS